MKHDKLRTLIIKKVASYSKGYVMLKVKTFIKVIIFQLLSLQSAQCYTSSPETLYEQILTRKQKTPYKQILTREMSLSAYDRSSFLQHKRDRTDSNSSMSENNDDTSSSMSDGISLFDDPITRDIDLILQETCTKQKTCTKQTVEKTLNVIEPNLTTKTNQSLSMVQQFALHKVIENLLQRCDALIKSPDYKLSDCEKKFDSYEPLVKLKRFKDFPKGSTEQLFLKFYKYLTNFQNHECLLPRTFNPDTYLNTTDLDDFFESSDTNHNEKEYRSIHNPITFQLRPTLIGLAKLADKLEEQVLSKKSISEPELKRARVES